MNDAATTKDLLHLEGRGDKKLADISDKIDKRFDELLATMSQFAQDVDMRFSRVENDLAEVKQGVVNLGRVRFPKRLVSHSRTFDEG